MSRKNERCQNETIPILDQKKNDNSFSFGKFFVETSAIRAVLIWIQFSRAWFDK